MKRLIGIILLIGLIYGGYIFYTKSSHKNTPIVMSESTTNKKLTISTATDQIDRVANVLGASVGDALQNGQAYLSDVTKGKSEPIINELVSKTTETLKDLPRREAEKIKYEFCKGVVTEYENKSTIKTEAP
jgi:hypothetical protein